MRCTSALMNCDSSCQVPLLLPSSVGRFSVLMPHLPLSSLMTMLIVLRLTDWLTNGVCLQKKIGYRVPHLFFFSSFLSLFDFGSFPPQCYFELGSWSQLFLLSIFLSPFSFLFLAFFLHFLSCAVGQTQCKHEWGDTSIPQSDSLLRPLTHTHCVWMCLCVSASMIRASSLKCLRMRVSLFILMYLCAYAV